MNPPLKYRLRHVGKWYKAAYKKNGFWKTTKAVKNYLTKEAVNGKSSSNN